MKLGWGTSYSNVQRKGFQFRRSLRGRLLLKRSINASKKPSTSLFSLIFISGRNPRRTKSERMIWEQSSLDRLIHSLAKRFSCGNNGLWIEERLACPFDDVWEDCQAIERRKSNISKKHSEMNHQWLFSFQVRRIFFVEERLRICRYRLLNEREACDSWNS